MCRVAANVGPVVGQIAHLARETAIHPVAGSGRNPVPDEAAATPARSKPHSAAK